MKRFSLVMCLALAISFVFVGSAFANFGPHGGYTTDTDACAGCHRAHTSFSTITFEPKVQNPTDPVYVNALLVGGATTMTQFCYACHGAEAPGAATNVQMGIFDTGPSTASLAATDALHPYKTASTFGHPLNGGGMQSAAVNWDWETAATPTYKATTSAHSMEKVGVLWGAGNGSNQTTNLTCTSCHDPHGSTNYRLLKDTVNGLERGGYNADGTAKGIVFSTETGYNLVYSDGGWLRGPEGIAQIEQYVPDYTGGTKVRAFVGNSQQSLSYWCAACHTNYDQNADETAPGSGVFAQVDYGSYEGTMGAQARHRHPVNIEVSGGDAILQIKAMETSIDPRIPLEVAVGKTDARDNKLGCLTCHVAHGSSQDMKGFAAASLVATGAAGNFIPVMDGVPGVNPDKADVVAGLNGGSGVAGTSALLRADNRGVCERCHNK